MGRGIGIHGGIFLISIGALMLEVGLTRLLSVAFWHHFAFLVISIALFGIAASGTYLSLFPIDLELEDSLSLFAIFFSISAIGGYALINEIPFDPFKFFLDRSEALLVLLYYVLLAIPFFFFGLIMAVSFAKRPGDSGKLYFANLTGSGVGSFLVLGIFSPFGGAGVLVVSAMMGSVASLFFSRKKKLLKVLGFLALLVFLVIPSSPLDINVSPYKTLNFAMQYHEARLISTQWNSISRVDVIESGFVRYAPGLSLTYQKSLPPQIGLVVDGEGLNAITEFNGSPLEFTSYLTSSAPYILNPGGRALIIEAGGGLSIVQALSNKASRVKVVESNPLVIETVSGLQDFSSVYDDGKVEVVESEARSFLDGSDEVFDTIEIGLSSSAPASSTGVYALTENYIFTVEAFKDYLHHLSEDGILSVTRRLDPPPRESLRILSITLTALDELNSNAPEENIAVIRSLGTITILVKKNAFTSEELSGIRDFARSRRFDLVYLPDLLESEANIYNRMPEAVYYLTTKELLTKPGERRNFFKSYLFNVEPTRDDNPFFFHFFKPDKLRETVRSAGEKWQILVEGGFILYLILLQAIFLCLLFLLLPLAGHRGKLAIDHRKSSVLFYFFLIGLAFMLVEIPLIQRFILFLGKPVYAVSTVLFGLLVFSGFGSLYSNKSSASPRRLRLVLTLLSTTILAYLFLLPVFLGLIKTGDIRLRYLISVLALGPLGFLMGMPLPTGIRLLERIEAGLIPWAWAANGSASVLGSILAVIIALHSGFFLVIALASLAYATSLVIVVITFEPRR
jgi:hypothetical protein